MAAASWGSDLDLTLVEVRGVVWIGESGAVFPVIQLNTAA
jgi:hypothetical protein